MHISLLLYVSEATLSRFAKKYGFKAEKYKRTLTALEIEKNISPL